MPPAKRDLRPGGRLLPAFPFKKRLPFVLGAVAAVILVFGVLGDNGAMTALGVLGLAATAFAFFVAPLLIGRDEDGEGS